MPETQPDTQTVEEIEVVDNHDQHRYEARTADGRMLGFSRYRPSGDTVVFTHTEVDPATEGRGVGSRLVRGSLDDLRRRGLTMVPRCPFVQAYVDEHPEYEDLVDETY